MCIPVPIFIHDNDSRFDFSGPPLTKKELAIIIIISLFLTMGPLLYVFFIDDMTTDASEYQYSNLEEIAIKNPDLYPEISKMLKDRKGKISVYDYKKYYNIDCDRRSKRIKEYEENRKNEIYQRMIKKE